jgi:hypothetical protein
LLLEANSKPAALVDERGCRRDIRSNGWTVISAGFALTKTGSAEEAQYPYWRSSFGADPKVRSFIGGFRQLRFGPDVFADALVPLAGAWSLGGSIDKIPENDRSEPFVA